MLALLPLIQKLILEYMTKKTHAGFSLNFTALGLMAVTGILGLVTVLFILLALQAYLAEFYGVPAAWLLTAAATFVITCIVYLIASYSQRKRAIVQKVKEEVEDRLTPMAQIIEQLAEPVKDHPLAAVLLAGLAGVMAGEKLHSDKGTD